MVKRLAGIALVLLFVTGFFGIAHSGPIAFNQWYEFSFTTVGVFAKGCKPADPAGALCVASSGGNSLFADAPPWTFTSPGPVTFTVTDAFLYGDAFWVYDSGSLIFSTPEIAEGGGATTNDPEFALLNSNYSHASYIFSAGDHSITISPYQSPWGGGAAYFRAVSAVPEPTTLLLLGAGMIGLFGIRKKIKI